MKKVKKFLAVLLAVVMCMTGVLANTVNANAATTKKAAINSVYRGMIVSEDTAYYFGSGKLFSYNFKTKKCRKLVTNVKHNGQMLLYKGYLYYEADASIYRVKADGSSKSKRICKNGELGFARNNRIYYGKNGLCSMKTDGSDKKQHVKTAKTGDYSYVFYYNGRYYFGGFLGDMYSVNTKFKKKKKLSSEAGYQAIVKGANFTNSTSSREMNNGSCWSEVKTDYTSIAYSNKNGKKRTIYKTKSKNKMVLPTVSYVGGYLMIYEVNKSVGMNDMYEKGTYKIINLKGKVLATLKKSQR